MSEGLLNLQLKKYKTMSKKALFTFVTDGITYERGSIHDAKDVKHLDKTNFEDSDEVVEKKEEAAKPKIDTAGTDELDSSKKDEDLDSTKKDEEKKEEEVKPKEEAKPKAK